MFCLLRHASEIPPVIVGREVCTVTHREAVFLLMATVLAGCNFRGRPAAPLSHISTKPILRSPTKSARLIASFMPARSFVPTKPLPSPPPEKPTRRIGLVKHRQMVGLASWYGAHWQGRITASGKPFNDRKMTAAHRTLPLDTRVKVTNLENGRSVEVTITDRGPYVPGRVIDLSKAAARKLGMLKQGLAPVRIASAFLTSAF